MGFLLKQPVKLPHGLLKISINQGNLLLCGFGFLLWFCPAPVLRFVPEAHPPKKDSSLAANSESEFSAPEPKFASLFSFTFIMPLRSLRSHLLTRGTPADQGHFFFCWAGFPARASPARRCCRPAAVRPRCWCKIPAGLLPGSTFRRKGAILAQVLLRIPQYRRCPFASKTRAGTPQLNCRACAGAAASTGPFADSPERP